MQKISLGVKTCSSERNCCIHKNNNDLFLEQEMIVFISSLLRMRSLEIISVQTTNFSAWRMSIKAAALVTDEGGITCHAAIVSRELVMPCIVGTKIATKILKDRYLV